MRIRDIPVVLSLLLLASCGGIPNIFEKPVVVQRPALVIQEPQPASQAPVEWIVVTRENFDARLKELEAGGNVALFAVTPHDYQSLSLNEAELRRYIIQLRSVLDSYKRYQDAGTEVKK